jgi:IPT/TIG domain
VVTTPGGTSPVVAADDFTYTAAAPAITGVSPNSGPKTGGTTVTITGTGFTGATKVTFAGVAAASFTVVSATKVTAVSPPGAVGVRNIVVTTPGGASPVVAADDFTYTSST